MIRRKQAKRVICFCAYTLLVPQIWVKINLWAFEMSSWDRNKQINWQGRNMLSLAQAILQFNKISTWHQRNPHGCCWEGRAALMCLPFPEQALRYAIAQNQVSGRKNVELNCHFFPLPWLSSRCEGAIKQSSAAPADQQPSVVAPGSSLVWMWNGGLLKSTRLSKTSPWMN